MMEINGVAAIISTAIALKVSSAF